jgi:hypothetical protein
MPQRLVTQQDLIDNPDLIHQGVSINQHYNFPDEEKDVEPAQANVSAKISKLADEVGIKGNSQKEEPKEEKQPPKKKTAPKKAPVKAAKKVSKKSKK